MARPVLPAYYEDLHRWPGRRYGHITAPRVIPVIIRDTPDDAVSNITYIPPVPHSRPATFQCVLALHPRSTLRLTMDVTKSFLRYTEHPPDAQRGWDLPPAVITPLGQGGNGSAATGRIYTPALLVDLATPDFSMPYNVIIFTCSLVAFLFGSVFNLLTRKFVVIPVGTKEPAAEKPVRGRRDSCTSTI